MPILGDFTTTTPKDTMAREHDLTAAATAAGLIDHDLLRLAMPDVPPTQAIADLRRRYPQAFPKNAFDMTRAEFDVELARLTKPPARPVLPDNLRKNVNEMTLDELEKFEQFQGIHPTATERDRRARIRARQRDERDMRR